MSSSTTTTQSESICIGSIIFYNGTEKVMTTEFNNETYKILLYASTISIAIITMIVVNVMFRKHTTQEYFQSTSISIPVMQWLEEGGVIIQ